MTKVNVGGVWKPINKLSVKVNDSWLATRAVYSRVNSAWVLQRVEETTDAPGPKHLIHGDMDEGYFGMVSNSDIFGAGKIRDFVNPANGVVMNDTPDWFKFAYAGKVLFFPKRPIVYSSSWDNLNTLSAIFGTDKTIGGVSYKVRVMTGTVSDPYSTDFPSWDGAEPGGEFEALFVKIHTTDGSWESFSNQDLQISTYTGSLFGDNYGRSVICQETSEDDASEYLARETGTMDTFNRPKSENSDWLSWRPVLEVNE